MHNPADSNGRCKSCGANLWVPRANPAMGLCIIHGCKAQGLFQPIADGRERQYKPVPLPRSV